MSFGVVLSSFQPVFSVYPLRSPKYRGKDSAVMEASEMQSKDFGTEEKCEKSGIYIGHSPVLIDGFLVKGGIIVEHFLYNMITE